MRPVAIVLVTRPEAALRRVAGMSLLQRVVYTAAANGSEVLVAGDDPSVLSTLDGAVDAHFEPRERLADVLATHVGSATLWLAHHVYFARGERSIDASSEAGARAAAEALWQSCRKPGDGYVSRHLNRSISLAISRRIVDTSITPNQVSALCIALGIASGVLAAQGGYFCLLAGAALFQLNSILDGVDGELARVRWAYSKTGELLDSAADNIANFSFFGGVTLAAQRAGRHDLVGAGLLGLSLWALYLVFLYARLSGSGRGDVMLVRTSLDRMQSPLVRGLLAFGRKVLRRDSFVMISFVVAALGYAPYLLSMILAGGCVVVAYAALHFAARWLRPAQAWEVDCP